MLKHQLNFLTIQTCVTCVKDRSVSKQKNDPITLIRWSHTLSCPPPRVSRSSATDSGSPLSLSLPAPGPPPALTPGIAVQAPSQIWLRWMMFGNWLKVFNQKSQDFPDVLESNWSNFDSRYYCTDYFKQQYEEIPYCIFSFLSSDNLNYSPEGNRKSIPYQFLRVHRKTPLLTTAISLHWY